jgi:BirA family transcriptional regulator, biotin operon repressor / biotin---[acetyl-CoA-carboxylase] ligase
VNEGQLRQALAHLSLGGGLRYFEKIGSTNDEAQAWASQGAPDWTLLVADEQTAGRGRTGRKWLTLPGTALAFSLILRPSTDEQKFPARVTGLGALAVVDALEKLGINAQVKWPNDVLIDGRKAAGILVKSVWAGDSLEALIVGIGINVLAASVPPMDQLLFPATSIENALGHSADRIELLSSVLAALKRRRAQLAREEFLRAWEGALAFRGEQVEIVKDGEQPLRGSLLGLETDGSLVLMVNNKRMTVHFGEVHLRPAPDKISAG